jgi:acyl-coenzyme A synthetase/AMP-(fatty) acid ligase
LAYDALRALAERTIRDLNCLGIGRGDRVALCVPNGPEAATAFACIAAGATAAPVSPGLTVEELEFNLRDVGVKALVLAPGSPPEARRIADKLHVRTIDLVVHPERGAGSFSIGATSGGGAHLSAGGPAG